jgi:hypothetical protein
MNNKSSDAVYALGVIGAGVYFLKGVASFTAGAVGVFKALTWPAWLVYEIFKFLAL